MSLLGNILDEYTNKNQIHQNLDKLNSVNNQKYIHKYMISWKLLKFAIRNKHALVSFEVLQTIIEEDIKNEDKQLHIL